MTKTESADSAILAEQVRQWTQERDRLQDLIDVASGTEFRLAATTQASTAQAEAVCEWTPDDYDDGYTWSSSCGQAWSFIDGGPVENRVSFCHHCGKPVVIRSAGDTGSGE